MIVSFIIVARNAESTLPNLLSDLLSQTYNRKMIQLIFVDSCSTDKTREVFNKFKEKYEDSFLSILVESNPKRTLPCGWNVALNNASGDVILRVDAHSRIPKDFIENNVFYQKNGEFITGGPRISLVSKNSIWNKFLLFIENSLFGSGIAKYRHVDNEQYVSTLAHACYRRKIFNEVGIYNELLSRTEDNDMHFRMKKKGYKFFFSDKIKSFHYVRSSLRGMSIQKFLNGKYIGLTLGISPKCFSLYHFVPFIFVLSLIFSLILSLIYTYWPLILILLLYFVVNIIMTISSILNQKFEFIYLLSPIVFFYLHLIYGIGTLYGILILPLWKKNNKNKRNSSKTDQMSHDSPKVN